jgi:SAM-dependent methyltransferase
MNTEKVRNDFDEIARLSDPHDEDTGRYDAFLLSLVPGTARTILDVGCGMGWLTAQIATPGREVLGIDLSPEMIVRARAKTDRGLSFLCADFLQHDFGSQRFDCTITSAAFHHLPVDQACSRLIELLEPNGRLIIHDMRTDARVVERLQSRFALAQVGFRRLLRTGNPRRPPPLRAAWDRHCAGETYLTLSEAKEMADRLMSGARVYSHWLWRYTIVWDRACV